MDDETGTTTQKHAKRLCNEIQLFDLCDLETCKHKDGRFCTNSELLERFENIAEVDARHAVRNQGDGEDDTEEGDEPDYDEVYGEDDFGDDEDGWEDE